MPSSPQQVEPPMPPQPPSPDTHAPVPSSPSPLPPPAAAKGRQALFPTCEPLPTEPLGIRLCETFPYTWNAILKVNEPLAPWSTITAYPLKPRVLWRYWQDAAVVVGTRFDDTTQYGLIDVDAQSPHHPHQDAEGISRIQAALETIGLCRTFCTRSSDSNGIHLWLPLGASVPSFWLATTFKACLESHGLAVKQGELETFPNCKAYAKPGTFSDYQGHRLPLQPGTGSVLLNADLAAVPGGLAAFFDQWDWAAAGQDLPLLIEAIALAKAYRSRRRYKAGSAVIAEWRLDLKTEITEGWTAHGQTNHLLKTIACYGVVFQSLSGERLEQYILDTVERLPGYFQWCRHQHEIKDRIQDWAHMADGFYWALGTQGTRSSKFDQPTNNIAPFNGNQQKAAAARARIQAAVAQLEASNSLPDGVRQRMDVIALTAKCSKQTLQKVKELWHPEHVTAISTPLDSQAPNSQIPNIVEALPEGNVCTTLREGDRGESVPLEPNQPKAPNLDETGLVHTFAPQMKGGSASEILFRQPNKIMSGLPGAKLSAEEKRVSAPVVVQPPSQSVTIEGSDPNTTPQAVPQPQLQASAQTKPPAVPQSVSRAEGSQPALTALANLLKSYQQPHQTNVTPSAVPLKLPSDPLPVPPAGLAAGTGSSPERLHRNHDSSKPKRRLQPIVKSGIDPTALPPHVTYIAPAPVYPAIRPDTLSEVNAAIGLALRQLEALYHWTTEAALQWVQQLISTHFGGRRRSQLADRELPLLLAKLQEYWQQAPNLPRLVL